MTTTAERQHAEAVENRHAKYAMKFVNDSGGAMPTDAKLAEVLADCARPPKPDEYPAIREHVRTYLDGGEAAGRGVRAALLGRAESYSRDASRFADMGGENERWAPMYRIIADELRKVAASL